MGKDSISGLMEGLMRAHINAIRNTGSASTNGTMASGSKDTGRRESRMAKESISCRMEPKFSKNGKMAKKLLPDFIQLLTLMKSIEKLLS